MGLLWDDYEISWDDYGIPSGVIKDGCKLPKLYGGFWWGDFHGFFISRVISRG